MAQNNANWMANPTIQQQAVGKLVFPGTHDSGSYSLTPKLSQVSYPNIAFLWLLQAGNAPLGAPVWRPPISAIYVGQPLYQFIFQLILDVSEAQDQSILNQLNDGIRYFDLRVYYDSNANDVLIQHGLQGCSLSQIVSDVASFVNQTEGQELIFLELSHQNFGRQSAGSAKVVSELAALPSGSIYTPYSLNDLAATQLSTITANGCRIIVMNTDPTDIYEGGGGVLWSAGGFQNSGRSADGVDQVAELYTAEMDGLQQTRTCPFYQVNWTLTPQTGDIVTEVMSRLSGNSDNLVIENLAAQANPDLGAFIAAAQGATPPLPLNLVTVDWYQNNSGVVASAIQMSMAAGG